MAVLQEGAFLTLIDLQQPTLPVQDPPIWPDYSPLRFHQGPNSASGPPEAPGCVPLSIS